MNRPPRSRTLLPRNIASLPLLFALLAFGGCEIINYRSHPELNTRLKADSKLTAAPADIEISQISTGGVSEEVDEYSEEANRLIAVKLASSENGNGLQTFTIADEKEEDYAEVIALAKTVMNQINVYAYHGFYPGFKHKEENFRYSIGDISDVLEDSGSDKMLFLFGYDAFTTSGRKFVNGLATVLSAAASGGQTAYIATEGTGIVYAMLVDKDGEVLWITQYFDAGLDLRKEKGIDTAVDAILADLAKAKADKETQ